jgi:hypothetical protein
MGTALQVPEQPAAQLAVGMKFGRAEALQRWPLWNPPKFTVMVAITGVATALRAADTARWRRLWMVLVSRLPLANAPRRLSECRSAISPDSILASARCGGFGL